MRIGIVTDIHEKVELLRKAIERLNFLGTDRIVVLGDVAETCERLTETVEVLIKAGADGVFGNHDLGLCYEPEAETLQSYPAHVVRYLTSLQASCAWADCLFTHTAPWSDATDPMAYYTDQSPHDPAQLTQTFEQFEHRLFFIGHYHRWQASSEAGNLEWAGDTPLVLEPERRYLVTIHAIVDGWCALYDTVDHRLQPIRV